MRSTMVMWLLVGPLLAQTRVDFSGVFLKTATTVRKKRSEFEPRILVISQTPDEIVVKAMQNGETAVAHYPLEAKKSDKVQAKLRGRFLVLTFDLADLETSVSEKWVLSPDGQQLTIQGEQGAADESDIYLRKPTLEEAQASVNLAVRSACKRPFPFPQKSPHTSKGLSSGWRFTNRSPTASSMTQSCQAISSRLWRDRAQRAPRSGKRAEL
jgi:hypothetical protein